MAIPSKITLPAGRNGVVRDFLEKKAFRFTAQDHAFWHAESGGVHIIFYKTGSVVVQGNEKEREKWLDQLASVSGTALVPEKKSGGADPSGGRILGLDESGKGDYFGPLVLAGAVVSDGDHAKLAKAGVTDSKKLSDSAIHRIFDGLSGHIVHRVRVIEPEEYNRLYSHHKNLNRLMMDEYKKLIGSFGEKAYDRIILDQFSSSERQNEDLRKSLKKNITIVVRAEENPSVAFASIAARHYFTEWVRTRSEKLGRELPIGSGPLAGELFARLKNSGDRETFLSLAKAHFKSGPGGPGGLF